MSKVKTKDGVESLAPAAPGHVRDDVVPCVGFASRRAGTGTRPHALGRGRGDTPQPAIPATGFRTNASMARSTSPFTAVLGIGTRTPPFRRRVGYIDVAGHAGEHVGIVPGELQLHSDGVIQSFPRRPLPSANASVDSITSRGQ